MVVAGDFRNGITFDMDGQVMQVIEFQHVKPGKGAAFVRTKLRNVMSVTQYGFGNSYFCHNLYYSFQSRVTH